MNMHSPGRPHAALHPHRLARSRQTPGLRLDRQLSAAATSDGLPPYVSLMYKPPGLYDNEGPLYVGAGPSAVRAARRGARQPEPGQGRFARPAARPPAIAARVRRPAPRGRAARGACRGHRRLHAARLGDDHLHPGARRLRPVARSRPRPYARYGKFCENFLIARRLVEAGVSVVTLKVGDWDTHEKNFRDMREQLPQLDRGFHALVSDLHDRGLQDDVAVVLWGEFGRAPRISRGDGRDHWPEAGAAVLAGGGFKVGQVIGETDSHGAPGQGHALHAQPTSWPTCIATWASTRPPRFPTTTGGRCTCSTTANWCGNWFSPPRQDALRSTNVFRHGSAWRRPGYPQCLGVCPRINEVSSHALLFLS